MQVIEALIVLLHTEEPTVRITYQQASIGKHRDADLDDTSSRVLDWVSSSNTSKRTIGYAHVHNLL